MNNIEYKPLTILVDIDNVILDTERAILERYNKEYNKDVKFEDITTWDFFNDKVDKDFFNFLDKDDFWLNEVKPIEPMCEYVRMMVNCPEYFDVKLVTATNPLNPALQRKLMNAGFETGVKPKNIVICNDKSLIHGDIMIDDYEENIRHSNCWNNWLIDRPWNKADGYWNDIANSTSRLSAPFLHDLEKLYEALAWCNHSIRRVERVYID